MTRKKSEARPLRVLHLVDSLRVGGKERQTVELVKGLCRFGSVESMVITMGAEQFYVADIGRLGVPLCYLLRKVRWDPTVFPRLWRILRRFRPHIIHTNSEMAMSYAWPLARLMGIKLINGTVRNAFSGNGLRWQWHKLMLHLADARVANSKAGFVTRGIRHDGRGNYVIHNGFDLGGFESRVSSGGGKLGFDANGRKVVGMVAEFSDYKDFSTFIQAAQEVLARRRDVVFVAVGDGKNLNACRRMVSTDEKSILFLGERKDVETLVQRMDIGVLCTFTEGISNSVMEYMAAGKPVVATRVGGMTDLIEDGVHGLLVPPGDPRALAGALRRILRDPAWRGAMGERGRERQREEFDLDVMVRRLEDLYEELFQRSPTSTR